ncbi:MAG: hypothetical protein AAGD01_18995 [Acidobacteriota bacterium]
MMWINRAAQAHRVWVVALAFLVLSGAAVVEAQSSELKDPAPAVGVFGGTDSEATGGPDDYGYTFEDSDEPSCPFAFVDISSTGTSLGGGDDEAYVTTYAESFTFYAVTVIEALVSTNGYISTDITDPGGDLSNDCPLPAVPSTGGGARIYPLHDDLVTSDILVQYFDTCPRASDRCLIPESCTVIQWQGVTHFGDDTEWNQQAILYHKSGDIVAQVGTGNPEVGSGSTTGIQNESATDALTYACNVGQSVPNDTGVCFRNPDSLPAGTCLAPVVLEVPTASPLGLLALFGLLALAAWVMLRRRGR